MISLLIQDKKLYVSKNERGSYKIYKKNYENNVLRFKQVKSIRVEYAFNEVDEKFDSMFRFLSKLLENETDIQSLEISRSFGRNKYLFKILESIKKNKTINYLKIDYPMINFTINTSFYNCHNIKKIGIPLTYLPKIRLPRFLEELYISGYYTYGSKNNIDEITHNINNYKIKSLSTVIIHPDIIGAICKNRYLLDLNIELINVAQIRKSIDRNNLALERSIAAAKTLLMIRNRKMNKNQCDLNLWLPKEIVIIIAKQVKNSYYDPIWDRVVTNYFTAAIGLFCGAFLSIASLNYLLTSHKN